MAENNGIAADGMEIIVSHGGLLPNYKVTQHVRHLVILVCASFTGQVISVMLNRQLFIKTPCNPGFVLDEGYRLSSHLGRLPQLFMDTAALAKINNVIDQDIPLVGDAVSRCAAAGRQKRLTRLSQRARTNNAPRGDSSFTAVYCFVMLATSLGLLFTINTTMAVVLLGLMPIYGLVASVEGKQNGQMSSLLRRDERDFKAYREQLLFMNSVKKTLGQEKALDGALEKLATNTVARAGDICVHTAVMQAKLGLLGVLFNAFELGYGGYLIMTLQLSVGNWIAFYSAAGSAMPLLPMLAEALRQWHSAREALTLMRGIHALRPERFKNMTQLQTGAAIALEDLSFTYFPSPGPMSLIHISALVPSGSKVALCGRSGCGKTTLMRLLCRLYQPTTGRIVVNGVCLNEVDVGALIAVVEQEVVLFDASVMENIRMADPDATDEQVAAVAAAAAVAADVEALDGGFDFNVGLRGKFLSGGQRQRIGFARALLRNTPILLLDEPVAAQDKETLERIADSVTSLCRRDGTPVTVISSSHSLAFFSKFTYAMYIANKTLVEFGTIAALTEKRGLFYQLVNAQEGMTVDASGRAKLDPAKLRSVWLFAQLQPEGLARLAAMFTTRKLGDGEMLYNAGDVQETCYIIAAGRVEFREPPPKAGAPLGPDGKPVKRVLRTLEPGCCFNEECLLRDVVPTHEASAEGAAVLLACARVYFDQVLQICPPIAEAVKDMVKRREEFLAPAALRAAWPLSTISDASAAALVEQGFRLDVVPARTQLFCAPGSACAALTVVLHGTVAVTQSGADDRLRISAGGFLGEATLLADVDAEAQPRLLTATAVDDCVLAVLPRESLAALMGRDEGVKASVRGVADAWVAGRSPTALARHWLLAPLAAAAAAAPSTDGHKTPQALRALSEAVTTRLLAAGSALVAEGARAGAAPALLLTGKLIAARAPPGNARFLRELAPGEWCAAEALLPQTECWTASADAQQTSVLACLPRGALAAAAAALPGVQAATEELLRAYQQALHPSTLAALKLAGVSAATLAEMPGVCTAVALRSGEVVFAGRESAPWLARVLWGEVRTASAKHAPGDLLCTAPAGALAPSATRAHGAAAFTAATGAAAKEAPCAVVLLMDIGSLTGPAEEARRKRAAQLQAAASARGAQQARIQALKREVLVRRMALEGTHNSAAHASAPIAAEMAQRRGALLFRTIARRVAMACRLQRAAVVSVSLEDAEAATKEELAAVEAEIVRRTAERARLAAEVRAAWAELEPPGDAALPRATALALSAVDDVSRAGLEALQDAIAAATAARAARAADIAAELAAAAALHALLQSDDKAAAADAARLAAAGLQRAMLRSAQELRRDAQAEHDRRMAHQESVEATLAEIRLVLAVARPEYDQPRDELARLPARAPTLAAVDAHTAALARATESLVPEIASARIGLEALWAQLAIPAARRAPFVPTADEAPTAAVLRTLLEELMHLSDAAEIVARLEASRAAAAAAEEPTVERHVGGIRVGPIQLGGRKVRLSAVDGRAMEELPAAAGGAAGSSPQAALPPLPPAAPGQGSPGAPSPRASVAAAAAAWPSAAEPDTRSEVVRLREQVAELERSAGVRVRAAEAAAATERAASAKLDVLRQEAELKLQLAESENAALQVELATQALPAPDA